VKQRAPWLGVAVSAGCSPAPTWHDDVAPLLAEHCVACHSDGGVGPFALDDRVIASAWADEIARAAEDRIMPPWHAETTPECTPSAPYRDDPRLTDAEIALLRAWADAGAPAGDPRPAPRPSTPFDLEDPDSVLEMPVEAVVDGPSDSFWCYSLDPGLAADVWLTGVQIRPGNSRVLHHAFLSTDPHGESVAAGGDEGAWPCFAGPSFTDQAVVGAYLPGAPPLALPANAGIPVSAGARLVLSVHYHPTGADETDRSTVALRWRTEPPDEEATIGILGNIDGPLPGGDGLQPGDGDRNETPEFRIPAGASGHIETMVLTAPAGGPSVRVWAVGAHMHWAGRRMRIEVETADATTCLLDTPRYDFDWQRIYAFDGPLDALPIMAAEDRVRLRCEYENTMDNPRLRDALEAAGLDGPVNIGLGTGTLDEMCLGYFGVTWAR
jgi:hypothetical protein